MKRKNKKARIVGSHYKIIESKTVGDIEIALGQSVNFDEFATWERSIALSHELGFEDWFFDNYFENYKDALADYNNRINQEKEINKSFSHNKPSETQENLSIPKKQKKSINSER